MFNSLADYDSYGVDCYLCMKSKSELSQGDIH